MNSKTGKINAPPGRQPHGDPNGGSNHPGQRPYWKHAHRDWRLWVFVVLMLAALMIYLTNYEMVGMPGIQPAQPLPGAVGK